LAPTAPFQRDSRRVAAAAHPQAERLVRVYFASDTQAKFPLNPNDFLICA
jgi:hypothetical protein